MAQKLGETTLHGVFTRTASYPRVCTAQARSPHVVGPPGSSVTKIRSDPPSGLLRTPWMHASRCRSVCIGLHRASRCRALLWHLPALASRCKPPLWHWHRDASPVSSISVQDAALCEVWPTIRSTLELLRCMHLDAAQSASGCIAHLQAVSPIDRLALCAVARACKPVL